MELKSFCLWRVGITGLQAEKGKLEMEQNFIKHGDDVVAITGNARCTNGDCPYIKYAGDCTGNIENCEYRQQRNDVFINYTFDGIW